ncbi:MAG: ABC transporter ATP-binding protein, partial [Caldilinea sp.]|nr:ABC transporter ATP-binding protein [Caldilinea sp.]
MTADAKRPKREKPSFKNLGRAIRFLGHYRNITIAAYVALFLSTGAQLLVPQLVQNILDAVTRGMMAQQLATQPAQVQSTVVSQAGMTM